MAELEALKALEEKVERLLDRYAELETRASGAAGAGADKDREIARLARELEEARRLQEAVRGRVEALVARLAQFDLEA